MDITFKSVAFRNFMSYGNNLTTFEFDETGTILISGLNGAGKSTLFNALTYALYDKPISNISKDNLVNYINEKNMEVTVEFSVKDVQYVVKRERKKKGGAGGNNVYLFVDGVDKTLDSVVNTNNAIEEILGIKYDLFVRIVVFFATNVPFLELSKAEQAGMFERLVGLTILTDKANKMKELIKESETSLRIDKANLGSLEREWTRYDAQVTSMQNRIQTWSESNAQDLIDLQDYLDKLSGVDVDAQQALHDEFTRLHALVSQETGQLGNLTTRLNANNRASTKAMDNLTHLTNNTCPYCLQQYGDTKTKIEELKAELNNIDADVEQIAADWTILSASIADHKALRDEVSAKITTPDIKELVKIKNQSGIIQAKIEALREADNPHLVTLVDLIKSKPDDIDYTSVNELTRIIEHQKLILKLLTKKDSFVRRDLLNRYIPYINSKLHYYLTELGLPHKVEFTHEMTADISQFGRGLNFGNLSQGQKARVNLALSLAFSDALQHLHAKINIQLLDEVLDVGLDASGILSAAKLIKRRSIDTGTTLYVISHKDEIDGVFDKKIEVYTDKGFSYLKHSASPVVV